MFQSAAGYARKYTCNGHQVSKSARVFTLIMGLTEDKATNTEEAMHWIQPPSYYFLQVGRNFANQKVERPVRCSGDGDTLRTDGEGKDLLLIYKFSWAK
jgi:hypothetical protein